MSVGCIVQMIFIYERDNKCFRKRISPQSTIYKNIYFAARIEKLHVYVPIEL